MKKNIVLYYIAIFGVFFINLADISKVINIDGNYRKIIYIAIALLFVLKIITSKISKKEIIPIIILGAINLYTTYVLDNYMFLMNFLAIIAIKDTDIKKIVKIDICVKLFYLAVNTIFYFYDYNFNYYKVANTFVYTKAYGIRHALYFSHPNTACGLAIWCAIDILYAYGRNLKNYIISILIVAFYFYFTVSRTSIIVFGIFFIALLLCKNETCKKYIHKITRWLIEIFLIITILITIMPEVIHNDKLINNLDKWLSRRITYSNAAYDIYGFHIIANKKSINIEEGLIIDNFYMRSITSYGLIITILLMVMYKYIKKDISDFDLAILFIFPIYLFNELFCYNLGRAIALLVLGNELFNKQSTKIKELK